MNAKMLSVLLLSLPLWAASCPDFTGNWKLSCTDSEGRVGEEVSFEVKQKGCESLTDLQTKHTVPIGKLYTEGNPKSTLAEKLGLSYQGVSSSAWNESRDRLLMIAFVFDTDSAAGSLSEMWLEKGELHLRSALTKAQETGNILNCVGRK
jgi:hypothetical protein